MQTKDRKKALIALEKILSSDNLEIATYVLQQVLNAKQLDPDILLLTYNKYKDNTGPRNEISLPPNISLDKFDVDLKIYDRLIKRRGEDSE